MRRDTDRDVLRTLDDTIYQRDGVIERYDASLRLRITRYEWRLDALLSADRGHRAGKRLEKFIDRSKQ